MEKLLATVKSFDNTKKDKLFIVNKEHVVDFVESCVSESQYVIFSSYIPEYQKQKQDD